MTTIGSLTDLETWVNNENPGNVAVTGREANVVKALQRAEHPRWGTDWSEWLEQNGEKIALDAVAGLGRR